MWHIPLSLTKSLSYLHCLSYLHHVAPGEAPHLLQGVVLGEGQGGQVLRQLPRGVSTGTPYHRVHGSHQMCNLIT